MVVSIVALLIAGLASSCTTDVPTAETTTTTRPVSAPASETPTATGTIYSIGDLGVRFELPASFASADDDALVFLARSLGPRAIFSIDAASSDVTEHGAESGETVTPTTLGEVDAVVVSNASVDGLPSGISANEILVSNGTKSFSVILSAAPADLAEIWAPFIDSLTVEPA